MILQKKHQELNELFSQVVLHLVLFVYSILAKGAVGVTLAMVGILLELVFGIKSSVFHQNHLRPAKGLILNLIIIFLSDPLTKLYSSKLKVHIVPKFQKMHKETDKESIIEDSVIRQNIVVFITVIVSVVVFLIDLLF